MLTTDTKSTQNYQDKNISINKMNRYGVNLTKKKNVALISTQNVITETLTLFVIIKKMLTTDTRKISTRCSSTLKLHIDLN